MKLSFVEPSGFRGFRKRQRIDVPAGFLVVCGPNGSGKTSLCDAIEFALVGEIQWRQEETERNEGISDYYWWRGQRRPRECYVKLGLSYSADERVSSVITSDGGAEREADRGNTVSFRRAENGETSREFALIREGLTEAERAPERSIERLCRTSIIRDEEITELSIELAERDRYRFVVDAVGSTDLPSYERKAEEVAGILGEEVESRKAEYGKRKEEVNRLIKEKSKWEAEVEGEEEVAGAIEELNEALDLPNDVDSSDVDELVSLARSAVSQLRSEIEEIQRLEEKLHQALEALPDEDDAREEREEFEGRIAELKASIEDTREERDEIKSNLAEGSEHEPKLVSLVEIHEHGRKLGLEDGYCPLCGSEVGKEAFEQHLASIANRVSVQKDRLDTLRSRQEELEAQLYEYREEVASVEDEFAGWKEEQEKCHDTIEEVDSQLRELGWSGESQVREDDVKKLKSERQTRIASFLSAVETLESSQAAEKVGEIDEEIKVAREELETAERRFESANEAAQRLESASRAFSRIQGDIIDERLSAISPVLEELYVRLRPHVDWREVSYQLRGNVRRFLSLEVGDELNPRFLFSSGQRRASGLAFLFAVHLSAAWSNLETIVLDDPVQHIDDYRALHLVEVLTALRKHGRQVICTVEDRELANLMCRRLNTGEDAGALVELSYSPGSGIEVIDQRQINPVDDFILQEAG